MLKGGSPAAQEFTGRPKLVTRDHTKPWLAAGAAGEARSKPFGTAIALHWAMPKLGDKGGILDERVEECITLYFLPPLARNAQSERPDRIADPRADAQTAVFQRRSSLLKKCRAGIFGVPLALPVSELPSDSRTGSASGTRGSVENAPTRHADRRRRSRRDLMHQRPLAGHGPPSSLGRLAESMRSALAHSAAKRSRSWR